MSVHDVSMYFPAARKSRQELVRRTFDILIAAAALIAFAPLMILVAMAVSLDGERNIIFEQKRLGLNGRLFNMYKFRKFRAVSGTSGAPLTVEGDVRLTKVGKILAATKLDELPQLWNVLKGDMALVGPRPESMAFADCFRDGYEEVLRHKPGVVGPSQVVFRNEGQLYPADEDPSVFYRRVLFPAKAQIDMAYFRRRSLGSDFMWMLRTVLAVGNVAVSAPLGGLDVQLTPDADRR
jgi:lipopolysaccharide/colanic/teichoic acid biosynthesis glycosyltransferase